MDLREAKAVSKLLHALAGDTTLHPVTAAAAIETLSFSAGTALQVTQILSPTGLRHAVATTTNPNTTGSAAADSNRDTTGGGRPTLGTTCPDEGAAPMSDGQNTPRPARPVQGR